MKDLKHKAIAFLFFFMFMFCVITGFENNIVKGATDTVFENWDSTHSDYNAGSKSGTGTYGTWESGLSEGISNTWSNSGTKSIRTVASVTETWFWYNLTSDFDYIGEIEISLYYQFPTASNGGMFFLFYNNSIEVIRIQIYITTAGGGFQGWAWKDSEDNTNQIYAMADHTAWHTEFIYLIHTGQNNFDVRILDDTRSLLVSYNDTCVTSNNFVTFDQLKVVFEASSTSTDFFVDDINLSLAPLDESEEYGDVSQWDKITSVRPYGTNLEYDYRNPYICDSAFLEFTYNVEMDCNIKAFDLYVGDNQWRSYSLLTDYYLYINGFPAGFPDYAIPYQTDGYILRWYGLTIPVSDEYIVYELLSTSYSHFQGCDFYWSEPTITTDDGDYIFPRGYFTHDNVELFGNGNLDGDYTQFEYAENRGDIGYTVYFIPDDEIMPDSPYDDTISTNKIEYVQYEYVSIDGTVSTFTSDNYVHLYRNTIEINNDSFPRKVPVGNYDFSFGFRPEMTGSYEVKLKRASVEKANCFFTVVGGNNATTRDYILWTSPPKTKPETESFQIRWYYNNPDNNDGLICLFKTESDSTDIDNAYTTINISSNGTGVFYHPPFPYYATLYLKMYSRIGTSLYVFTGAYCRHYVTDNEQSSYINVQYKNLYLSIQNPVVTQHITGFNAHTGSNTVVQINNITIATLTTRNYFNIYHNINEGGFYNVSLVIDNPSNKILLGYDTFTVGGSSSDEQPEEPLTFVQELFGEYYSIVGVIVVALCMLLPLIIAVDRGYKPTDVPLLVYIVMGCIGVGLSTIWGLLGVEWILLIVVALFSTTIISIVLKVRGGND